MSTKAKNIIAQRILSALLILLMILAIPYIDDITAHMIFLLPLSMYLLLTRKPILEMFRD